MIHPTIQEEYTKDEEQKIIKKIKNKTRKIQFFLCDQYISDFFQYML